MPVDRQRQGDVWMYPPMVQGGPYPSGYPQYSPMGGMEMFLTGGLPEWIQNLQNYYRSQPQINPMTPQVPAQYQPYVNFPMNRIQQINEAVKE